MKAFFSILLLTIPISLSAQWGLVGNAGFSAGRADYSSIAVDSNLIPYVSCTDDGNGGQVVVYKFEGNTWSMVGGAPVSQIAAAFTSLAISPSQNLPYVIYQDLNGRAMVRMFDGNAWQIVGGGFISAGAVQYPRIVFDRNSVPYVVYRDSPVNGKATVMKLDGGAWVSVGNQSFSPGSAHYTSIAIDTSGRPVVAFRDIAVSGQTSVMRFDGTSWGFVGMQGISAGDSRYQSVEVDEAGNIFVTYVDIANSYNVMVMKYDGSNWQTIGNAGPGTWTWMKLDSTNNPYVGFSSGVTGFASCVKFVDTVLVPVGNPDFSAGGTVYNSFALDRNDVPYVAFYDATQNERLTVMSYGSLNANEEVGHAEGLVSVYPNPGSGQVQLRFMERVTLGEVQILGIDGREILSREFSDSQELELDVSFSAKGMYFIRVVSDGRQEVQKYWFR